jgi:hypothetical protein
LKRDTFVAKQQMSKGVGPNRNMKGRSKAEVIRQQRVLLARGLREIGAFWPQPQQAASIGADCAGTCLALRWSRVGYPSCKTPDTSAHLPANYFVETSALDKMGSHFYAVAS